MGQSPQEVLLMTVLSASLGAAVLAGALRLLPSGRRLTGLLISAGFLAAYVTSYGKVPSFPPVGAVNKVFYIALAGALLGLGAELLHPRLAPALTVLLPVLAAVWIGQARITAAPWEVALAAICGLGAMLLLSGPSTRQSGETAFRRAIVLTVFCLGFAPIALLGASSSGMQLVIVQAAMLAAVLIWRVWDDGFELAPSALLGGAGGLLALVLTICLITRKADLLALAVLTLVLVLPLAAERIPASALPKNRLARVTLFTLTCLAVAAAAALVAALRYGEAFPI